MNLIGLSGVARSGKDEVASILIEEYGYRRIAFADPIREALYILNPLIGDKIRLADFVDEHGWDVAKARPEVRRLLQVFGADMARTKWGRDFWVDQAFRSVQHDERVVFSDVRFPNEAEAIKELGGQVWRIDRGLESINAHISEHALNDWSYDHIIANTGTLADLADQVVYLIETSIKK